MQTTLDVNTLPVAERLRLMETLWESLCAPLSAAQAESAVVPAWHNEVLTQRIAGIDSGSETVSPWSQAKERIRAQVRGG